MTTSGPVTEIVTIPIKPSFFQDAQSYFKTLSEQKGFQRQVWGTTLEDENILQWFIDWDDITSHEAWVKTPPFEPFWTSMKTHINGGEEMVSMAHAPFPPDTPALQGPIIELTVSTPKPGVSKKDFGKVIDELLKVAEAHKECKGVAWGWSVPDGESAILALSWTSKEAHMEDFRNDEGFKKLAPLYLEGLADEKMCHIKVGGK